MIVIFLASLGCQTRIVPISKRHVSSSGSSPTLYKKGRRINEGVAKPPQIFVRKKKIKIKPVLEKSNDGSLASLSNPENYLFYNKPKGELGDILNVLVRVNQKEGGGENQQAGEQEPEKLKDELLAALPQFTPGDASKDRLPLSSIKFKVDRRLPNGDLIVSTYRTSQNENHSSSVRLQARIARSSIMKAKEITTEDLLDVDWYERKDGEVVERESLAWQDEYTLRLSGFDEANSKMAQELENKRQDLGKISDRLRKRIGVLSKERQNYVLSRQKLDEEKRQVAEKLKQYTEEMEKQQATIAEQKDIIKRQETIIGEAQAGNEAAQEGGGANE